MVNNTNDIGFIHDLASLDKLRQDATSHESGDQKAALSAAAKQFESIFTSMLFKSMRDANSVFESDLAKSQNQDFYRQMYDEQMASELSSSGSLGLADMIVAQLGAGMAVDESEVVMRKAARDSTQQLPVAQHQVELATDSALSAMNNPTVAQTQPSTFDSPDDFVQSMRPYAEKAARALGIDASLLIAQAALETGWGKKMVKNSQNSSNNLFNIKADRSWKGDKIATQTLEFHDNVPVKERASFRAYNSYEQSFNDLVRFLNDNPRYQTALQQNHSSEDFIRGVHAAGYATDPNYADKVLQVKQRIDNM